MHRKRRDIGDLQSEIHELFADLWQVPRFSGLHSGFRPQVDCYRTEDPPEVTVLVELPGVDPANVELVVAEGTLVVAGERLRPRCAGLVYQQMELEHGTFRRQVQLPADVDVAGAHAMYEHGILKVVLPIAERQPSRSPVAIEVTHT